MVNTNDNHTHDAPVDRRSGPGWGYWASTLLGAPLATIALGLPTFLVYEDADAWLVVTALAVLATAISWFAPGAHRLSPTARTLGSLFAAGLSVVALFGATLAYIYVACLDTGCFG